MENRVLRYFLTVAREENVTRAAEVLNISQPALSRQLMQLEEELGAKLFVRGKRNITLTEEGRFLRHKAQEIVDLTEKTEQCFHCGIGSLRGEIAIGMGESSASALIADYLSEFIKRYPDVRFKFYTNNADYIKEQIEKGLLDIGVLLEPVELSKYDYLRLPVKDAWGVVANADSTFCKKNSVSPQDLENEKLFLSARSKPTIIAWLGEYYREENVALDYNLLYNAATLVEKGMGTAVSVDGAFALYLNPKLVFRPLFPKIEISTVFVWKKYQVASPTVLKFIEFVKNAVSL